MKLILTSFKLPEDVKKKLKRMANTRRNRTGERASMCAVLVNLVREAAE